jgi:elongation factor G
MKVYDAANIRNVAVVGHSGSGKTQLAAALLFDAGAVNRFGKVDDGTTITDYDDEEIARKHTLAASLAWCEWNGTKINLIDTPGMGNFLSDAKAALRVADAAVVVVDAVAGAEVQTEKVWAEADALGLPRVVVMNRLDRERASVERALASVREACSRAVTPIQIPIGEEKQFRGVVDLVSMKSYTFAADGSGKMSEGEIPGDLGEAATSARESLIEMVAEADDALMERFFEAGTLTQDELLAGLRKATAAGRIAPLVCTSGLANIGIQTLLDAIVSYVPSPTDRRFRALDASTSGR